MTALMYILPVSMLNLQKKQQTRISKSYLLKHLPQIIKQTSLYSFPRLREQMQIWYSFRFTIMKHP